MSDANVTGVSLPPAYESPAAENRIVRGLMREGVAESRARWAARVALDEAPFAGPTQEAWVRCCSRARSLAHSSQRQEPVPFCEPETFRILPT